MVLLHQSDRINKAIAANAGVYTFPDSEGDYPYSLPEQHPPLANAFKKELIVLLGELDNSSESGKLDESESALRQGKHRLERGKQFFATSKKIARNLALPFNWKLQIVPNTGHDKRLMIQAAAELL
ncbi:hypothetical protein [Alteromonas sp. M12]|uniref:hypothetical protein n=1 Tax=Alteromonas sp. M12 TaxID=3135644 RepID=UPI00319E3549